MIANRRIDMKINCQWCGSTDLTTTNVYDIESNGGYYKRRRRQCRACDLSTYTIEGEETGETLETKPIAAECPDCGCRHLLVGNVYHRKHAGKVFVRRRRICAHCARPFYTRESYEDGEK